MQRKKIAIISTASRGGGSETFLRGLLPPLLKESDNGAKSTDGAKIADYLHKDLKNFSGLSGPIAFDAKGDREGEVYRVYKVDADGKFVMQKL